MAQRISKIVLTDGGVWDSSKTYPPYTYVRHNGDGWWSTRSTTASEPAKGNANWVQATDTQEFILKLKETTTQAQAITDSATQAEQLRVEAEQVRAAAENERNADENLRKLSETERLAEESKRQNAEKSRVAAEAVRDGRYNEAEENRNTVFQAAESERQTAEEARKQAEAARIQAENERDAAEQLREALTVETKAAAADAKSATEAANTAAGKANEAADKFNAAIVQETGDAQDKVISQHGVTEAIIGVTNKLTDLERVVGITSIEVPEFVIGMESTDGHSVTYYDASNRCRFADGMYMESHQGDIFRIDWSNYGMYVIEGVNVDGVWQYESQGWKSADYVAKFENGRVYCAFRYNDQRDISQEDINIIKGAFSFIPLVPSTNNIEKLDERVTALEQASPSPSGEYVPFASKLICGIGDSIMIGVAPNGEAIVDGEGEMGMQFNSSGGFLGSIKRKYPSVTTLNMGIGGTTIARNAQVPSNVYGCIADRINNIPNSVDYIILEGGINDYFHLDKIPFGAEDLLKDYTPYFAEWDSSTETYKDLTMGIKYGGGGEDSIFAYENFVGALHIALAKIMTRFYDKKYMYVIPHNTNNDPIEDKYFDAIVSVCKKMQFPCLDLRLYSGMSRIAQLAGVASTSKEHKFTIDAVHPNQLGYDLRYMPAIVDFLKKL